MSLLEDSRALIKISLSQSFTLGRMKIEKMPSKDDYIRREYRVSKDDLSRYVNHPR